MCPQRCGENTLCEYSNINVLCTLYNNRDEILSTSLKYKEI